MELRAPTHRLLGSWSYVAPTHRLLKIITTNSALRALLVLYNFIYPAHPRRIIDKYNLPHSARADPVFFQLSNYAVFLFAQ